MRRTDPRGKKTNTPSNRESTVIAAAPIIAVDARDPPEHVPLVVRTIGATARERRFDVSPAITRAMPISSALETS